MLVEYQICWFLIRLNFILVYVVSQSIVAQLVGTSWCVHDIHGPNPPSSVVSIELSKKKKKVVKISPS